LTIDDVKLAIAKNAKIRYVKKGTIYQMLGVGKGKLDTGEWFEGGTFRGDDGVYYTRPYHMFDGFEVVV
jgi:hypothetical protein